jgi:hypothetical protein
MMAIMHTMAAAAALLVVIAAAAQQAPLPDVNVTAQAPIKQVNPFQPFFGNTQVDEARWPVIPCASARINLGPGEQARGALNS